MRALILCAGLGERLRPITLTRAKPSVEFLNMSMLAFPYFWLDQLGLSDLTFNTHYLPETIRRAAMHVVDPKIRLHFTQEENILGSGGGIWNSRFQLQGNENFAVANGDAVLTFASPYGLKPMLAFHNKTDALATLLVCPLEGVGSKIPGVWHSTKGEVLGFGKEAPAPGSRCSHFASIMLFSQRVWRYIPEGSSNILYDVLVSAIKQGERILAFEEPELKWFETGNIKDYLCATKACLEMLREQNGPGQNLQAMLNRFSPDHALCSDLQKLVLCEQPIPQNVQGFSVISGSAFIKENICLRNAVVLSNAHVLNNLEDDVAY